MCHQYKQVIINITFHLGTAVTNNNLLTFKVYIVRLWPWGMYLASSIPRQRRQHGRQIWQTSPEFHPCPLSAPRHSWNTQPGLMQGVFLVGRLHSKRTVARHLKLLILVVTDVNQKTFLRLTNCNTSMN